MRNQLPPRPQQPVLTVQTGQTIDAMYMGFHSDVLPNNEITDYLVRVVKPKLDAVDGVQTAEILGARNFALRAWLDPASWPPTASRAADVSTALAQNNYSRGARHDQGPDGQVDLTAATDLHSVDDFKQLVDQAEGRRDRAAGGCRQRHARRRELRTSASPSTASARSSSASRSRRTANILDVAQRVREVFPDIQAQLPRACTGEIVYDATDSSTARSTRS